MREITDWLCRVEAAAAEAYGLSAAVFSEDEEFVHLLLKLRADELEHYKAARKASELIANGASLPCILSLDRSDMEYVEDFLLFLKGRIKAGKMSKEGLLHYIITIETKECNDFMHYVVNWLFREGHLDRNAEELVVGHRKQLEEYVETLNWDSLVQRLDTGLSPLRGKRLLVVSRDGLLEEGIKAIYSGEEVVFDRALDVKEALESIGRHGYSAVMADDDVSGLDLKLFSAATGLRPELKDKLIVLTRKPASDPSFMLSGLRVLRKPARVQEIKNALSEIV
ncbi:MAG: hypothetical protein H3C68_00190 [Deltaproteobacteria bacterium]|nr:hypothetical protein [Deltaproteobacteria bacterium]MBZ0219674.1 hypothetical protein [Deltaproteobacteria bacterium]